jgi:hypothetical protein
VGGVCEEKQKITMEWEEFVKKSRKSSGSRRSLWGIAEDHQGVGGVCEEKQNITKEWEKLVRKSRLL